MSLKFCANLNFMFGENGVNLLEKYRRAHKAGFHGVETGFPTGFSLEDVKKVQNETGMEQVLLNICLGDVPSDQFGCASFPNREEDFKKNLDETIRYAKGLECKKIHIMGGKLLSPPTDENHKAYIKNLQYAAKKFEQENIIGLIEPINKYSVPGYYLNNYEKAIEVIKTINSPNLKIMLDLFHLQMIRGNITNTIKEIMDYVGHVQIAQAPDRHEPNSNGEVNFPYVLRSLENGGYNDWIGCEYKPKNESADGLTWISQFGYKL